MMSRPQARSPAAGRPRSFDSERALDSALELFWRNGFRVTTTRDLEAGLGLNASSIYNAFGSKEALLIAALERYEEQITNDLLIPLETSPQGLQAIDLFFRALGYWITHDGRRGCMLVNLMAEDGGETATIAKRVRRYRNRLRRALRNALERARDAGELRKGSADSLADLLLCQVFGLNIAARGGASGKELRRFITAVRSQIESWKASRQ